MQKGQEKVEIDLPFAASNGLAEGLRVNGTISSLRRGSSSLGAMATVFCQVSAVVSSPAERQIGGQVRLGPPVPQPLCGFEMRQSAWAATILGHLSSMMI